MYILPILSIILYNYRVYLKHLIGFKPTKCKECMYYEKHEYGDSSGLVYCRGNEKQCPLPYRYNDFGKDRCISRCKYNVDNFPLRPDIYNQ